MAQRGRVSMAALMVKDGLVAATPRPDAPYNLGDEEAEEWRAIVNSMPADHFIRDQIFPYWRSCVGISWRRNKLR